MGSSLEKQKLRTSESKGRVILNKTSEEELQLLQKIYAERLNFKCSYLCSVEKISKQEDSSNIFCQNLSSIIIQYEPYEYLLSEVLQQNQLMSQVQIERIVFSVCSALTFLYQKKYRHGDIQPKLICYNKGDWKLLDNCFIKRGVSAYQKVLEGEEGFVSPIQMQKIRHGFTRQSPPIQEADQVFGLGMTCLQLMTGKPSSQCYKQSYLRFNQTVMDDTIALVKNTFPQYFSKLVIKMVQLNQQRRITIKEILSQPFISRHSKKLSLRTEVK